MDVPSMTKVKGILKLNIEEILEFAPGFIMIIFKSMGGYIIYFDRKRWGPRIPQKWNGRLYPKRVKKIGIGMYREVGYFPKKNSPFEILKWAQNNFIPSAGNEEWND